MSVFCRAVNATLTAVLPLNLLAYVALVVAQSLDMSFKVARLLEAARRNLLLCYYVGALIHALGVQDLQVARALVEKRVLHSWLLDHRCVIE